MNNSFDFNRKINFIINKIIFIAPFRKNISSFPMNHAMRHLCKFLFTHSKIIILLFINSQFLYLYSFTKEKSNTTLIMLAALNGVEISRFLLIFLNYLNENSSRLNQNSLNLASNIFNSINISFMN